MKKARHIMAHLESLSLKDVSYEIKGRTILKHLSLSVNKGEIIGLHGNNGSGKSTLARLLVKSLVVSSGEILWNDISYHRLSELEIKRHVLLISSTANLLEGTAEKNILLGKKLSLNTETLQILERIGLQPASMISIGGSNLLQGQKRIIEMLRAVYCDFDMIVFDEPLIFLDAEKRDIFRSMIRKNLADKTILIIFNEEEAFAECSRLVDLQEIQENAAAG